jgi:hypothetical protein
MRVFLWNARQSCLDRIVVDVLLMGTKTIFVFDPRVGEAALPNLARESQFSSGPEGKIPLDELHGFFNADVGAHGHEQMNVIRHHHEFVNPEFPGPVPGAPEPALSSSKGSRPAFGR